MALSPEATTALLGGLYSVPIIVGSCISLLTSATVLLLYRRYEELRRHPASLVLIRVFLDVALALLLISEQITRLSLGATGSAAAAYNSAAGCQTYAFFFQFVTFRV